jgi:hypothetical protein
MIDADILGYIGAISGVIGAVTGLGGAVVAYFGYRKTEGLKSLDLRLELRKALAVLQTEIDEVPTLIDQGEKSRKAIASATGMFQSGAMKKWSTQWEADRNSVVAFHGRFEKLNINYANAPTVELETNLVEAHCIQTWVSKLKNSYASSLAEDDRKRDHLREDMRARAG